MKSCAHGFFFVEAKMGRDHERLEVRVLAKSGLRQSLHTGGGAMVPVETLGC